MCSLGCLVENLNEKSDKLGTKKIISIEKLGLLSCHDLAEFYPFFITHIFVILRLRLTIINPINGFLMKIQ